MPLVVPGINSPDSKNKDNNKSLTEEWQTKLLGKTLGDSHSSTVFAKKELPQDSRVVKEGDMLSMDHKPDRLNVHVGQDGTVRKVTQG